MVPLPVDPYSTISHDHVCVCVFSSHSFWTSSSLDVPAGVTQCIQTVYSTRKFYIMGKGSLLP